MKNKKLMIGIALMMAISVASCSRQANPESNSGATPQENESSEQPAAFSEDEASSQDEASLEADSPNDFEVEPVNGGRGVEIISYLGNKQEVKIPSQIHGSPVTHIGEHAFRERSLTSVAIPSSVTEIGKAAFATNQLKSIVIPNNVAMIGDSAFGENQLKSVTVSSRTECFRYEADSVLTIPIEEAFDQGVVITRR
jgi:hypothetical protein